MYVFGGYHAIPHDFQCDENRRLSGKFARVVDEVTTDSDTYTVGVFFLREVVNYNAGICDGVVC